MLKKRLVLILLLAGSLFATSSCDDDDKTTTPAATPTLYERLGGLPAVTKVVNDFLVNVVVETGTPTSKLKRTFQPLLTEVGTRDPFTVPRVVLLRNNLVDEIGEAAGGPLRYKGKPMAEAHRTMAITDAEWDALVAELGKSLASNNVPAAEQTDLVAILASLKGQIVGQ